MKTTLTTTEIARELCADENANWSRAGAYALAEYLQQIEELTGEEIEMDRVAIRCDFSEYSSLQDWAADYYGTDRNGKNWRYYMNISEDDDEDAIDDKIRRFIEDNGALLEFTGGIIVSSF